MEFVFFASMEEKKVKSIPHLSIFSILPLSSRNTVKEAPANFLQKKASQNRFLQKLGCQKP